MTPDDNRRRHRGRAPESVRQLWSEAKPPRLHWGSPLQNDKSFIAFSATPLTDRFCPIAADPSENSSATRGGGRSESAWLFLAAPQVPAWMAFETMVNRNLMCGPVTPVAVHSRARLHENEWRRKIFADQVDASYAPVLPR